MCIVTSVRCSDRVFRWLLPVLLRTGFDEDIMRRALTVVVAIRQTRIAWDGQGSTVGKARGGTDMLCIYG